jgi:hypothetical protein
MMFEPETKKKERDVLPQSVREKYGNKKRTSKMSDKDKAD